MPEKHMVWGHGARFVQGYFSPKFGDFAVQFGLKMRVFIDFCQKSIPPWRSDFGQKPYVFLRFLDPEL